MGGSSKTAVSYVFLAITYFVMGAIHLFGLPDFMDPHSLVSSTNSYITRHRLVEFALYAFVAVLYLSIAFS